MLFLNLFFPDVAHAMGTAGGGEGGGAGGSSFFFMLIAIFAIFYFLMIRPESKRRKERTAMIDSLKRNDKIVTIGGLHATVIDVHDDRVVASIAEGIKVEIAKTAVSGVRESGAR
jgi:preprotein translocase subunit YajC